MLRYVSTEVSCLRRSPMNRHIESKHVCKHCGQHFVVSAAEHDTIARVSPRFAGAPFSLPAPAFCPPCREQQRIVFRNEWNFFHHRCSLTGRPIISNINPASPYSVVEPNAWWSDAFDGLEYGRPFDFSRPFFEQFAELHLQVPKLAIQNSKSENSDYTNYATENKNCYLCVGAANNESCFYSYRILGCTNVSDSFDVAKCENCYECVHGTQLYGCRFCTGCHNSSFLVHCEECRGCHDCFGCADLVQKSYCIFNQQYSKEEYQARLADLMPDGIAPKSCPDRIHSTARTSLVSCENSSGDQLLNCANCECCYTLKGSVDCRYVSTGENNRDCADCTFSDNSELQYFSIIGRNSYQVIFSNMLWYCSDITYSINCFNSKNLFGCSGLKKNEYCIFNKQYSKEDYGALAAQIAAHMQETGEWGQFFPSRISPFGYNRSIANEYYPLTREAALEDGWMWDDTADGEPAGARSAATAPGVLICSSTGKAFRMTPQEQQLYVKLGVSEPTECPEARRHERMQNVRRALRHYC